MHEDNAGSSEALQTPQLALLRFMSVRQDVGEPQTKNKRGE